MAWHGKDLKDHLVSTPLLQSGFLAARSSTMYLITIPIPILICIYITNVSVYTHLCGVYILERYVHIWKNPLYCAKQTGSQIFSKDSRRCEGKLSENVYVHVQSWGSLNLVQYN